MKAFPNGLTVTELKELLKDFPETNTQGEPTEVWFEDERSGACPVRVVQTSNDGNIIFE